jgi:hypothetical protein
MDDATGLSFDGRHSIDVREHWPSHRERTRCQYQGCVPADRASVRLVSTARSQHPEYCRRCRSHGGGCRVGLWHQPTSHDRFFVSVTILLQLFIPYHRYVFILKGLTVSLLAYAAVLFTVHVPREQLATHTVRPKITLDSSTPPPRSSGYSARPFVHTFFLAGLRRSRRHGRAPNQQVLCDCSPVTLPTCSSLSALLVWA